MTELQRLKEQEDLLKAVKTMNVLTIKMHERYGASKKTISGNQYICIPNGDEE